MSRKKLVLQFDRTKFYSLLEIFERVGRFRFGDRWLGTEAFAAPFPNLEENEALRYALEDELQKCLMKRNSLMGTDTYDFSREKLEKHRSKERKVNERIKRIRFEKGEIPLPYDFQIGEIDAFQRRQHVEREICDAFQDGKFLLHYGAGYLMRWEDWNSRCGFKISFGFSLIILPLFMDEKRRHPAFVLRTDFDKWAMPYESGGKTAAKQNLADQVTDWFVKFRDASNKRPNKGKLLILARKDFPNLPKRQYDMIWAQYAPDSWKKPGSKGGK